MRVGFGRSTGSGFPGESSGVLPDRMGWREIEKVTLAYGYGLSVTPLQLAQAYSVLANDGKFRHASLLRVDQPEPGQQVIAADLSQKIVRMLKSVIEKGSGKSADIPGYSVAGKTGTVHKIVNGSYADDRYMAIFAGMAPASDPRLVAVVVIDEPSTDHYYGGEVAAPVFSRVMSDALRLLDITPDRIDTAMQMSGGRKSA
jgi:cell division protein FtsI (penicillin-binding protein 3)